MIDECEYSKNSICPFTFCSQMNFEEIDRCCKDKYEFCRYAFGDDEMAMKCPFHNGDFSTQQTRKNYTGLTEIVGRND